ncbi:MAG: thioredoxin family protein [Chitinophagaceae bacterium]|nr:thioredoxin family protein [Chitinophagaceae bacterium]
MKKILLIGTFLFSGTFLFAQPYYELIQEANGPSTLKGLISLEEINKNGHSEWFTTNQQGYTPNALTVEALKKYGSSIHIVAFIGTWCDDTKFIFPKVYSLMKAASFPEEKLTVIGVDREKKTHSYLTEALKVENVPTFIIMHNGKELGRVVEYGQYGMWDKELGEVINTNASLIGMK